MAAHDYVASINSGAAKRCVGTYSYGKVSNIRVAVAKDGVAVSWHVKNGSIETFDKLTQSNIFLDAIKRAHLCFALRNDRALVPRKITVSIDGQAKMYDSGCPGFPFVYSMLGKGDIGLSPAWREMVPALLSLKKGDRLDDRKLATAYSYLIACGREFEYDRFTGLWTSMNAYYACRSDGGGDRDMIDKTIKDLGLGGDIATRTLRDKNAKLYRSVIIQFARLGDDDIVRLYDDLLTGRPNVNAASVLDLCDAINGQGREGEGLRPFACVLFEMSYYLRCKYIHGERATVLFASSNDYRLGALRVVNYFLARFLDGHIPRLLTD